MESISREQRRTLKLREKRGKSAVPRLLMSAIVGLNSPLSWSVINFELIVLFDLVAKERECLKCPWRSLGEDLGGWMGICSKTRAVSNWSHYCVILHSVLSNAVIQKHESFAKRFSLPPVVSCEHLQTHLSLSASFVLKSLPGCPMLLILPAVPL